MSYRLVLADGSRWEIAAGNEKAASAVSQLAGAMRLRPTPGANQLSPHGRLCRLLVRVGARPSRTDKFIPSASKNDGISVVRVLQSPGDQKGVNYLNLVRLSLVIARRAQARGGVLIHGALAERDGLGVIMAASSGTGKSTASHRLPAPWRSLCDDTTLMVRDPQGAYWAHPWPTWSRLLEEGPVGRTWDVQRAVPVKGIFILARAVDDRVERVGPGQAVSLLVDCVGQASSLMASGLGKKELRALHLERFNNLCALARAVPAHLLHFSLTGAFWREIEQALEVSRFEETSVTSNQFISCKEDSMKSSKRDKAEGKMHQAKGKLKEIAGDLSDNPKLEAEGVVEKTAGKVQEKIGQVKKVLGK